MDDGFEDLGESCAEVIDMLVNNSVGYVNWSSPDFYYTIIIEVYRWLLILHMAKERLHGRIVPAVSLTRHRLFKPSFGDKEPLLLS
ncbi:hypothetical protein PAV_5c03020 [Paenibacillus alvei DSM 29]|nr:hypothetical protein PAV_5c03020 [Paenibacillus alvei DSM 29]